MISAYKWPLYRGVEKLSRKGGGARLRGGWSGDEYRENITFFVESLTKPPTTLGWGGGEGQSATPPKRAVRQCHYIYLYADYANEEIPGEA